MSRLRSTRGCGGIEESIAIPLEKHHGHKGCVMPCEEYQKKQCDGIHKFMGLMRDDMHKK
jgi:hypothetical protein